MANVRRDKRSNKWLVNFSFAGHRFCRSCETEDESEAKRIQARVEETIALLKTGRLSLPESDSDMGLWIMSGGRVESKPLVAKPRLRFFDEICESYLQDQVDKAETTIKCESYHINHLKRILGERTKIESLRLEDMQKYVTTRREEDNRFGGKVKGRTIKKELTTFTQIWEWAREREYVSKLVPVKSSTNPRKWAVKIPKQTEEAKFMTWEEITKRISRGGVTKQEEKELWKRVYLDEEQIQDLLDTVKRTSSHSFIYAMFALTAFTGARRSEVCRSMIDDFNFEDNIVIIRERKRRKDRAATTREVPLHPQLRDIMLDWFADHPGGQFTITPPIRMPRRKNRLAFEKLTPDEARCHFEQTLKKTKWQKVRGFHVLRHSFGAICVRAGVPMSVTAKWMGHTTEDMIRLYQHLFPQDEQVWMKKMARCLGEANHPHSANA